MIFSSKINEILYLTNQTLYMHCTISLLEIYSRYKLYEMDISKRLKTYPDNIEALYAYKYHTFT